MITEPQDPVFDGKWKPESLKLAYEHFQIKDEWSFCGKCGRRCARVFDGKCYKCHTELFTALGRNFCPPLP